MQGVSQSVVAFLALCFIVGCHTNDADGPSVKQLPPLEPPSIAIPDETGPIKDLSEAELWATGNCPHFDVVTRDVLASTRGEKTAESSWKSARAVLGQVAVNAYGVLYKAIYIRAVIPTLVSDVSQEDVGAFLLAVVRSNQSVLVKKAAVGAMIGLHMKGKHRPGLDSKPVIFELRFTANHEPDCSCGPSLALSDQHLSSLFRFLLGAESPETMQFITCLALSKMTNGGRELGRLIPTLETAIETFIHRTGNLAVEDLVAMLLLDASGKGEQLVVRVLDQLDVHEKFATWAVLRAINASTAHSPELISAISKCAERQVLENGTVNDLGKLAKRVLNTRNQLRMNTR